MDSFAYVEPSVDRYAYVEQLYLLLVVSCKEKLEKMDSAVEVFSNDDGAVTRIYDVKNISRQLSGISYDDVSSDVITISHWIKRSAKEKLLTDEKNKGEVELLSAVSYSTSSPEGWWSLGVLAAAGCGIGTVFFCRADTECASSVWMPRSYFGWAISSPGAMLCDSTLDEIGEMKENLSFSCHIFFLVLHMRLAPTRFHRENLALVATSPHDPLGITDSACKNHLVVVSVQYGPFNTYIQIRSTTIGKSRFARDPIAMHTSWRSNSDIASVTSIGYPRMKASGESLTTKHRLLHASGPHPIPPPNDPNRKRIVVRNMLRLDDQLVVAMLA
ncbi:hypothetical protein F511_31783 [Dorcoceras hygrometricum]|uniref:Uncharacterized protein n=1 Tax=Dorcoceras hygrometricum TaxID=472368 RepID=A0A2Z7BL98_9LAMI|nr:hypothetical protein F511_31783 [Dorcoceras hygrometricum]